MLYQYLVCVSLDPTRVIDQIQLLVLSLSIPIHFGFPNSKKQVRFSTCLVIQFGLQFNFYLFIFLNPSQFYYLYSFVSQILKVQNFAYTNPRQTKTNSILIFFSNTFQIFFLNFSNSNGSQNV